MRGYLKSDVSLSPLCEGKSIELPKGHQIPIIRLDYLPDHIKRELSDWDIKDLNDTGRYLITYLRGHWFKVEATEVGYLYYSDWYN